MRPGPGKWDYRRSELRSMSSTSEDIRRQLKVRRQKQRAILATRWRCAQGGLEFEQLDTFYAAIRPYLCVAQFFGIMPLANIRSRDPQDVKFKVRSIGLAVTGLFLLLGGLKTLVGANILFTAGLNAKNMVGLVFLIVGLVNWLNFVGFARSWSHIMLPWSSLDILMLFPPYKRCRRSLRSKVNFIAMCVGVLAATTCCTMPLATAATARTSCSATRTTRGSALHFIWRRSSTTSCSSCPATSSPFATLFG
ncbi:gustatory receptor for sugar taste 61a [Drosophila teissieri]|uniref:gustatory receptor for sugar taste 61a n=1 Tax=Drosophila teissieri TaxID=7243 RepID=UPI001CB9F4BF|nr:gustatory receptor for sugar taste 61a [Drosophila teissieri]